MTGFSSEKPDREDRLDEAAAEYLESIERGERPNRDQWLARHPDLASELVAFIDDQLLFERCLSPARSSSDEFVASSDPLATLHTTDGIIDDAWCHVPNFHLISEIARGGMGIVYRARQLNLNRIVALKMILSGPHASLAELHRFRMETEAVASLDHPNIMPIYEVGEKEGRPFFSMKLMEGGTLAEHLSRYVGNDQVVATLLIKMARAIHHAHQRGILHRDLKPANILLDAQGEPYVTDFGLCRRVEVDSGMTQSGMIVGTPSYMSPEQAAGRKDLTTATDVYSLGAILYTLLTDRPPFRGNTPLETVRGVLEDEPSRPRVLRPHVDRDLETICLKCLQKTPERRYGSAEALVDDLQRWLDDIPIVARRGSFWERTWKRARRNPVATSLVIVSGLAVVFFVAAILNFQNHRITVVREELAKAKRTARLDVEVRQHIEQSKAQLSLGDARTAKEHALRASDQVRGEPELAELGRQAEQLLASAEQQLMQEQARADANESFRRFQSLREDVLFYGSQFTNQLPANHQAAQTAGNAALREVGLTPDGKGMPQVNPWLTDEQRSALNEGCYELLLVLADTLAGENPPRLEQALQLTKRALDFGPATSAYHFCQARYLALLGRGDEAAQEQQLAESLPAATALDHFLRGYDARRRGDLVLASDEFRDAIRIQPKHVWAKFFLAACCLSSAPLEADVHLTGVLGDRPDLYSAYLLRGIALANLGKPVAAENDFEQALAHAPQNPKTNGFRYATLAIRGSFRTLQGNFDAAERDLLAALDLNPHGHVALLNLAQTYERQGRVHEASVQLTRALAAHDLSPNTEAGILLYRAGSQTSATALADVRRAIEIYPYAEAWLYLAAETLRQNPVTEEDYQTVLEYCDAALESPVYSPETYGIERLHYLRAHALVELGRNDEAYDVLARYLDAGGKPSAEIHRLRGLVQVQRVDYPSAIHEFSESLVLDPDNASTLAERGSVYLAIGALQLAALDFDKSLAGDEKNGSALAGRSLIRALRGDISAAVNDAERAWEFGPRSQRIAWMAARTFAISSGQLDARGRRITVDESRNLVRYRERAVTLLEQAVVETQPDQQATFWREVVEHDAWLGLLNSHPRYRDLQQKFLPATVAPKTDL